MLLTNLYTITYDNIPYPPTEIMQKWYKEKVVLRVVQELQHCYIVGDGEVTQRVNKDMVTGEI